jgi:hypothetical protein
MRITPEILTKVAEETVKKHARADRGLVAAYLHGSVLYEGPLLGGAGDVDLVFIHNQAPQVNREIVRLTEEVHLDIAHHFQGNYRETRELRLHPWLGPTICDATILHDTRHFMDFTQASVRGMFHRPDMVLERTQGQAEHARQIWLGYQFNPPAADRKEIAAYLKAVDHAVNAVAGLSGVPLAERRFLLEFPARAQAVGQPGLYAGALGLLGGPNVDAQTLESWSGDWEAALDALDDSRPVRLHPHRRTYYTRAFDSMLASEQPLDMLWPLMRTWTLAVCSLSEEHPAVPAWREACHHLGLMGEAFAERLKALDAYLDLVEDTLEDWGRQQGA